ncbi:MAG: NF038120 family PEP-CTERM protein [Paucibacter sp.]|nr:NF038120 family PEP-CTERM protein [Roseateles sp.]
MKKFFASSLISAAALAAAGVAGSAHADVIDFEHPDVTNAPFAPLLSDGDFLTLGAYYVQAFDPNNNTGSPNGALVASLINGADPTSCLDGACPTGNATNYIGSVDDGVLQFGRLDKGAAQLSSFNAAFMVPAGTPAGTMAYLAIEADRPDNSSAIGVFSLGAVSATGTTAFQTFQAGAAQIISGTGTLTSAAATFYAFAYYCDPNSGNCSAFTSNKGQFALDDIAMNVSAVPEPAQWALMALGLSAIGAFANRRRSV